MRIPTRFLFLKSREMWNKAWNIIIVGYPNRIEFGMWLVRYFRLERERNRILIVPHDKYRSCDQVVDILYQRMRDIVGSINRINFIFHGFCGTYGQRLIAKYFENERYDYRVLFISLGPEIRVRNKKGMVDARVLFLFLLVLVYLLNQLNTLWGRYLQKHLNDWLFGKTNSEYRANNAGQNLIIIHFLLTDHRPVIPRSKYRFVRGEGIERIFDAENQADYVARGIDFFAPYGEK